MSHHTPGARRSAAPPAARAASFARAQRMFAEDERWTARFTAQLAEDKRKAQEKAAAAAVREQSGAAAARNHDDDLTLRITPLSRRGCPARARFFVAGFNPYPELVRALPNLGSAISTYMCKYEPTGRRRSPGETSPWFKPTRNTGLSRVDYCSAAISSTRGAHVTRV
jgi:hypothetical protein